MRQTQEERTLTKAEMEIMNILWSNSESGRAPDGKGQYDHEGKKGMTTHDIIEHYPDQQGLHPFTETGEYRQDFLFLSTYQSRGIH